MIRHLQMILTGKVENTGFRLFALWGAREMQISGEVKQDKGKIFITAEGEETNLDGFTAWCKKGPAGSHVESLEIQEKNVTGYIGFKIL
jgi:acylphosphatase